MLTVSPARAQTPSPLITVDPAQARAGALLSLNGSGFGDGGFDATVFWDDQQVGVFPVDRGGTLTAFLPIPLDASLSWHQVTVCAGNPCFTGPEKMVASAPVEVVELLPHLAGRVAFIYQNDVQTAKTFAEFLQQHDIAADLIPLAELEKTDLTSYHLLIVGPDTGNLDAWGTDAQVELMAKQPYLLGLGEGGYALFGRLKLAIGWPNGFHGQSDMVSAAAPELTSFRTPFDLSVLVKNQQPLGVLTKPGDVVAIANSSITGDVLPHGLYTTQGDPTGDAVIVSQGCRTLWGFAADPSQMTPVGQHLFINLVVWAASSPCNLSPTALCAAIDAPGHIPAPGVIDFDDLADGVVIRDAYANSHGVRFEDNKLTQARIYSDRDTDVGKSRSKPNAASNSAIEPNSSAGVPMGIDFLRPQSQVGLWVGNGKGASGEGPDIPGVLSAYDASGRFLCSARVFPVPASHTSFVGLFDAYGRIARVTLDYGDTILSESIDDLTFGPFAHRTAIQVCEGEGGTTCLPVAGAQVYHLRNGAPVGLPLTTDANGYVTGRARIDFGDELWVRTQVTATQQYALYHTSGAPVRVLPTAFNQEMPGVMQITVGSQHPLLVFNLLLASQWNMTHEATYRTQLQNNLVKAANYLYDFTDGQITLGRIDVYQNYDKWSQADVRLYANNNLRPEANPGGVVMGPTPDPTVARLVYYPGYVYMGRTWNRYGLPHLPADVPVDVSDDWSLALAHELGHYLLFLFDTYLAVDPNGEIVETDACKGSAMGWVYEPVNTEFIFDPVYWQSACGDTVANRLLHRTEWATIRLWYQALVTPGAVDPGPSTPPASLTSVTFHPPTNPGDPLLNQLFQLDYQDGETASAEARAILIRNGNRVIDQGQPHEGGTEILLSGAQTGDRFCVYDVTDGFVDAAVQRHQFGCEVLEQGDNVLRMEKDVTWAPVIDATPVNSRTVAITVTQPISSGQLRATLYPEDLDAPTAITLTQAGDQHTGVFHSPVRATAAYVQVYVDEAESELDPRREVMVDYGVGSSGAHGPTSWFDSAPVMSSDGKARYTFGEAVTLRDGEFLALQTTPGAWPVPGDRRLIGHMYKLIALPPALAEKGVVALQFQRPLTVTQPAPIARQSEEPLPAVHYWNGKEWVALESFLETGLNGERLIAARSQGVGFYAVLRQQTAEPTQRIYLPHISSFRPQMR